LINQVRKPSPEACNAIASAFKMNPEDIFRIAGLLPDKPEKDTLTKEGEYLLSQLSNHNRRQAVDFIRFLAEKGEDYAASSLEEPE